LPLAVADSDSPVLKELTGCTKINVGALGNIVRQLHVHVIARNEGDANWPGPVWGYGERTPYEKEALVDLANRIRDSI
jgi:diadenosine tetraphosphate (Ap4A) HIT family hydrolase